MTQLLFIGTSEIIIIVAVVLLLFGGKKIPELMHGMGKGVKSFRDGINGVDQPQNQTPDQLNAPTKDTANEAPAATNTTNEQPK